MKLLPPIESQDTMLSALSYPLGFFVSPFLLFSKKKEDSFVRFHAIHKEMRNDTFCGKNFKICQLFHYLPVFFKSIP